MPGLPRGEERLSRCRGSRGNLRARAAQHGDVRPLSPERSGAVHPEPARPPGIDHATTGFENSWLWLPTADGTFAMVVATVLGMIERPTKADLWTYVGAMILLLAIGVVGAGLHLLFDLGPSRQLVPEHLLRGAPLMAPLLFSNMGLVGLVALLPEREHAG